MERISDLQKIENELFAGFKEHKKQGKYYYDPELKKKVFEAYSLNISPKRISELCDISINSALNWFYVYRGQSSNPTQSTESNFREIKISPPEQEKIVSSPQENSRSLQEHKADSLKIKFPNGIEIECKTTEVNKFIHDLYFIKN